MALRFQGYVQTTLIEDRLSYEALYRVRAKLPEVAETDHEFAWATSFLDKIEERLDAGKSITYRTDADSQGQLPYLEALMERCGLTVPLFKFDGQRLRPEPAIPG